MYCEAQLPFEKYGKRQPIEDASHFSNIHGLKYLLPWYKHGAQSVCVNSAASFVRVNRVKLKAHNRQ